MLRATACLSLVLVGELARAQAPALPTPPPPATAKTSPAPPAATPKPAAPPPTATLKPAAPPPIATLKPAATTPAATKPPPASAADKTAPAPPTTTTTVQPATTTPSTTTVPKVATKKKRKAPPPPPPPAVELFALNTHESFKLRPDLKGRLTKLALRGWNRFLRCHHTGRVHAMSTRLAQLIYEVDKHFGFKRVLVVAGYRAPRVAREKGNPKSPHKKGVACDFRIEGVPNTELRDYERTLPKVGVGYYPNSEFVHLDVDPLRNRRSAFWIDYSRPGERARYSKNPEGDLQAEKEPPPADTDEDNSDDLAPMPPLNAAAPRGGGDPQIPSAKGASAPNFVPALQPPSQNP